MRKGQHCTEEIKNKIRIAHLKENLSEETLRKMSEVKIGENNPNYGKHPNKETREKMRLAHLGENSFWYGKHQTEEAKEKIRFALLDRHCSPKTEFKEGENNIMFGRKRPDVAKRMLENHPMKNPKIVQKVRIANSGKNNPNWKGGISSLIAKIRGSFKYRQWRSDVFTHDNFTCQECGDDTGGNLEAHHIKSFPILLQKYEIITLEQAINCEALWNINNGITLCRKCHRKEHRKILKLKELL